MRCLAALGTFGSEKQHLSIACALLKNASVIILDETTAALDTESEVAVQQAIDELVRGKTVQVTTHCLPTIRDAAQILVFERSELVESDRHEDLLTGRGCYACL